MNDVCGRRLDLEFGTSARDRLAQASDTGFAGALAALETFYAAFNGRDLELLGRIWADGPRVQLNNPLGGLLRGAEPIAALYGRVFHGPVRVWVAFHDVVAYVSPGMVTFAGRERGECKVGDTVLPLAIRTSRVIALTADGWRQVHHHGSIDDAHLLARYQRLVSGG